MKILMLFIVLVSFGCCPKPIPPKPEIIYVDKICYYDKCVVSNEPEYKQLDLGSHIGSAYNMNILLDNMTIMNDYVTSLRNTVECYERQSE